MIQDLIYDAERRQLAQEETCSTPALNLLFTPALNLLLCCSTCSRLTTQ